MLRWRERRARRRARKKKEEKDWAAEVFRSASSIVEEVVGPYVLDGSAAVERAEWDEVMDPEIRVVPANENAAQMVIYPMGNWIALSVEYGNLEIHTGDSGWTEELATCLRSVLEGHYTENGGREGSMPSVTMVFGGADRDGLTYSVGGLYNGAERDYPPGERSYSSYR